MRRRDLLPLLTAFAAAPLLAEAQSGPPVVGYLSNGSAEADVSLRTGLLEGLEQQGFVVGRNTAIEYRFAEGQRASAISRSRADRASGGAVGRVRVDLGSGGEEGDRNHPDRL